MTIYLFSQILKFTYYSIKLIEKLSRRHLINSSNVFVIKGFTVSNLTVASILFILVKYLSSDEAKIILIMYAQLYAHLLGPS